MSARQTDQPGIDRGHITALAHATAAFPFKVWGFGESIAMEALLAAGGAPGSVARGLIERWASEARPLAQDPLAHVAPGVPLLRLFETTGETHLLQRARELACQLAGTVEGRRGARLHRPDLAGWEHEVWVDCMHLDGPFLARLGALTGEASWCRLGEDLLLAHARVLQDERTGLFSHGFDDAAGRANEVHWGRGQGWALLGLADTAAWLPESQPGYAEVIARLRALVDSLAATEAGYGVWHTVVDHPATYLELSVSAFVALGVGRAVRRGLVDARFGPLARRAWEATNAHLTPGGELQSVSDATPVGTTVAHYDARRRGVFPWGQGPALLAAIEEGISVKGESHD